MTKYHSYKDAICCNVFTDLVKMQKFVQEEKHIKEENLRLQRKLQMERERRELLCRHLSESESSLEMDDERCVCVSVSDVCNVSDCVAS